MREFGTLNTEDAEQLKERLQALNTMTGALMGWADDPDIEQFFTAAKQLTHARGQKAPKTFREAAAKFDEAAAYIKTRLADGRLPAAIAPHIQEAHTIADAENAASVDKWVDRVGSGFDPAPRI